MKLVDINTLVGKDGLFTKRGCPGNCQHCGLWTEEGCRVILEAPTVDAVEVVHGWWVDEYPYVRCSECNAEWLNCRTDNDPKLFYYCPNCGAKMDGDGSG